MPGQLIKPSKPNRLNKSNNYLVYKPNEVKVCTLTRLNDIQQSSAHCGFLRFQLVEALLGQVLLEQRLAVLSVLQLLEAIFQFLEGCWVSHFSVVKEIGEQSSIKGSIKSSQIVQEAKHAGLRAELNDSERAKEADRNKDKKQKINRATNS